MEDINSWEVMAFESARGEQPVEEFIKLLDKATISKFTHAADLLEKHGPRLKMPHSKKITGVYMSFVLGEGKK